MHRTTFASGVTHIVSLLLSVDDVADSGSICAFLAEDNVTRAFQTNFEGSTVALICLSQHLLEHAQFSWFNLYHHDSKCLAVVDP